MNALGGYFGLELNRHEAYHANALKLNTGRNALEYILLSKKYRKLYIPYFTCDVLLEPLQKHQLSFEYYFINENFEPLFDFSKIQTDEAFLYTNYFGLNDANVLNVSKKCKDNLIVDNAQAFYAKPVDGVDTFYSPRKFFGVPDGAYLYTNKYIEAPIDTDKSFSRFGHLLKRIDESAEAGYPDFIKNDEALSRQPVLQMSEITCQLLQSIDYKGIAEKRKKNFQYLHSILGPINQLKLNSDDGNVPMVYPFFNIADLNLRNKLLENRIYTAQYWASMMGLVEKNTIEYNYCVNLIHLPIDQRMTETDLKYITKIIKS